jgi:hypothetical protein
LHRILIIGDAVAPTGFARVIRSIFTPLQDDFELHQLATRFDGRPHDYGWTLYPAAKGQSPYGYDHIVSLIDQIKPAIVFLLYDIPFQSKAIRRGSGLRFCDSRSPLVHLGCQLHPMATF